MTRIMRYFKHPSVSIRKFAKYSIMLEFITGVCLSVRKKVINFKLKKIAHLRAIRFCEFLLLLIFHRLSTEY